MSARFFKYFTVLLFLGVIYLPLLHYIALPIPSLGLSGKVKKEVSKPDFTLLSFLDGKYQENLEKWFKRDSGIWPYLVRTENQLNFSLFKLASTNYKSTVVVGKDNNLIERSYIRAANDLDSATAERLTKKVNKLKELQDLFESKGAAFIVMISPNKPALYPEFLPEAYFKPGGEERVSKYERMIPLLRKAGVNVLDGYKFFKDRINEDPYPFFDFSGTHWNEYGSCLIGQQLISLSQELINKPLISFTCDPVIVNDVPGYSERDLSRILNIWWPEATYSNSPRPKSVRVSRGGEYRPNVLFVGTSYMWALLRHLDVHRVFRKRDFYYYFKRNSTYPKRSFKTIDKARINWQKNVFSKDLVVLEVNEAFVSRVGYGFIKAALAAASGDSQFTSSGASDISSETSVLANNKNARKNKFNKKRIRKGTTAGHEPG